MFSVSMHNAVITWFLRSRIGVLTHVGLKAKPAEKRHDRRLGRRIERFVRQFKRQIQQGAHAVCRAIEFFTHSISRLTKAGAVCPVTSSDPIRENRNDIVCAVAQQKNVRGTKK